MFRREKSCDKDKKSDKQTLVKQKSIGVESAKTDIFKALSFKEKSKNVSVKQPSSLNVSKSAEQSQKGVRKSDKKDSDKNLKPSTSFCRSKRRNKEGLKQDDFLKATMRIFLVVSPPVGRMQVRSRSLNHLDNLEMRQGVVSSGDVALKDARSEPDCTKPLLAAPSMSQEPPTPTTNVPPARKYMLSRSQVVYEWTHINFISNSPWNDSKTKEQAKFISENTVPIGIKIYEDKIFMALRKLSDAIPVTLAYFRKNNTNRRNIPLIPYPSWDDNFEQNCSILQKAQSMEIDLDGVMWVIDGVRPKNNEKCPCKLVLLDLNNNGKNIHTYIFPEDVCRKSGGFLNDIVLDDTDGGYAYITDSSSVDPGLIVYSKEQNKSWKLRDATMYATNDAPIFKIDGQYITSKGNVNGIALSPKKGFNIKGRILYYSDGSDYNLYSISTDILRNETLCNTVIWKKGINLVGKKQGSTGGMICDNGGDLFYTLQSLNAIGKWNIYRPFNTSQVIFQDNKTLIWPDSFSMDNIDRDVYILSNHIPSFSNPAVHLGFNDVKFRLLKYHNGKKSYICTGPQVKVQCSSLCEGRKFWFCN